MRSRRGSAVFLFLKSVLRQTAFVDYKCDNRSRNQIDESNDSLQSDFQYNKTVLRNDNISFLINFNIVNNHLRRIILFKIRAAGKLERNYYFFGNCRNTVSE